MIRVSKVMSQYQLIYMLNIRRVKKRKIARAHKDDEQLATDKLFEISCLYDQKYDDESKVLFDDSHKHQLKAQVIKKKSPKQREKMISEIKPSNKNYSLRDYRTLQLTQIFPQKKQKLNKTEQCIINTVQSNRVFVGNKKALLNSETTNPEFVKFIQLDKKAKTEEMPIIEKHYRMATIKVNVNDGKNINNHNNSNIRKIRSFYSKGEIWRTYQFKQFNEIFQDSNNLKEKMRRDIFGRTQRTKFAYD